MKKLLSLSAAILLPLSFMNLSLAEETQNDRPVRERTIEDKQMLNTEQKDAKPSEKRKPVDHKKVSKDRNSSKKDPVKHSKKDMEKSPRKDGIKYPQKETEKSPKRDGVKHAKKDTEKNSRKDGVKHSKKDIEKKPQKNKKPMKDSEQKK